MTQGSTSSRSFKSLMVTQFLGAFNDNLYKLMVSLMIVSAAAGSAEGSDALSLGSLLFTLPFILFSPYAGPLCDRYSKTAVIRAAKVIECAVMGLACYFFLTQNTTALLVLLFMLGAHSTLFSPAKYGSLPELLPSQDLARGNGYLEFWTFVAILGGSALAGPVAAIRSYHPILPGIICLVVAAFGLITALRMDPLPPRAPSLRMELNPFRDTWRILAEISRSRELLLSLVAIIYFWLIGVLIQLSILLYAKDMMGATEAQTSYLIAVVALGIGIGSILAGRVAEGRVELGLIPLGSLGISLSAVLLGFSYHSWPLTIALLFLVGLSAGVFTVPIHAFFQHHSPEDKRGRYQAANNFVSYIGMMFASGVLWLLSSKLALSPASIFVVIGISALAVTGYIFTVLPESLVRCLNWLAAHSIYRMRVIGTQNIPEKGGALLLCNHLSFVDAVLLLAASPRPVRFIMYKPIYDIWPIRPIAKIMKTIPISPGKRAEVQESLALARQLIQSGEIVGIFPEGGISRHGALLPFRRGFETIMDGLDAPIIPAHLDQLWGSIFSNAEGKFLFKMPKQIPYPVTVSFGTPLPANTKAFAARLAVQELSAEAFTHREVSEQSLPEGFLRQVQRQPFRRIVTDSSGISLRYISLAGAALALSRRIKAHTDRDMVGIALPPSVAAVISTIAVQLAGKIPVHLNWSSGERSVLKAIERCQIDTVISDQKFAARAKVEYLPGRIEIADWLREQKGSALFQSILAITLPVRWIMRRSAGKRIGSEQLATVIFSSGSTAEPKGVMLTNSNIRSNIEALYDAFQLKAEDRLLGSLPFFHSFGFTATLWFPLLTGVPTIYHHNPLDAGQIGELIERHAISFLFATPTFLQLYMKRCTPQQLRSLRLVVVGAEKLSEALARAFEEQFKIRPLEGYGCTELSPVAILSIPTVIEGKLLYLGSKPGKAGLPISGVAARVVDPENGKLCGAGESGMLLIKGPNVMQGYLNDPALTAQVLKQGWYVTGDIAAIDEDGFIEITDRLSRFSKIGGEMVPHIKIEEALGLALESAEQLCVVTAVADQRRGERLIVLHTVDCEIDQLRRSLAEQGLPNLWVPKAEDFFRIEALPLLGSGKIDLKAIKKLAAELAGRPRP